MDPSPEGTGHDNFSSSGSSTNQTNQLDPDKKSISYLDPSLYKINDGFNVRKNLADSVFKSYNYPLQGIQFLQINAQYPSRLTKLIMFKCFLGRLRPSNWYLSPKCLEIHIQGLLVTNIV